VRSRHLLLRFLIVSLVVLGGCSAVDPEIISDRDHLARVLRSRNLDPGQVILPFGMTEEMRRYAHANVLGGLKAEDKLARLRSRLLESDDMKVTYTWGYTGTATEVFEKRQANCLAFTNLFVAMAREIGVPVFFLAVDNVENFRKEGDLVVVTDHVAVGFGDAGDSLQIYDFSDQPEVDRRFVRRISDLTAIALFYSNRGAEALRLGLTEPALDWLSSAVLIDPLLPNAWVNYGVALRRAKRFGEAETAYKKALEIDPRTYSAYNNLASLLRSQHRVAEATGYETTLAKTPNQNPYTYLSLGDISLSSGKVDEAERFYRRAVSLSNESAECLAALGQVAVATGDLRLARKMLKRASEIDGGMPRVRRLAEVLAQNPRSNS
jgi:Flp pilus assembly protein TadD